MKNTFKKGDRVKIVKLIGYDGKPIVPNAEWKIEMAKIHTISTIISSPKFKYLLRGVSSVFSKDELRHLTPNDPQFGVSDVVSLRKDLILNKSYGRGRNACVFYGPMLPMRGKKVTVIFVENKTYRVYDSQGRGWWINDKMIQL